jgi:hypothetical protein
MNQKSVAESQLNEYFVKAGMPVKDVLALNLFQDFDPVEGAAVQFEEFAEEPMWQQVVRKYAPIANMLKKKLLATKRPLTDAEAEAVEQTWYDGSDAYDDMEIEYLVDIYNQQIDTLEALLAGNLTDEEFGEGLEEAVTPASVSKVLRLIQRHHNDWFDTYGLGEVEDTVVDMAEMDKFYGMSAEDATALVGQELESLYGQQGVAEARNTNPRVNEIRQLAKDFFGGNPYSSGTIGGGTVLRLSFHIGGNLDGDYRYVPATQISPKDQQTLKRIKSNFEKFMASKGVSADEVSIKFHIGSGVYAGVRIAIPQEQGVAEADPNKFDSDVDYYAAQNAPAKPRHRGQQSPGVNPDDEAYFREIFRKKREAAKKAEQDKGQVNELKKSTLASYAKKAANSMDTHAYHAYRHQDDSDYDKKEKRKQGIGKAVDRLAKEQGVAEGEEQGIDNKYRRAAKKMIQVYETNPEVKAEVDASPEFYRAMVYETGVIANPEKIDGSTHYHKLVDELESILSFDSEGVAEADKKKDDEPEVRDVALQRAISRAKADFPTAGTGIEALAKDFMRSQDQDSKSFDQLRQAERKQDQMLGQIAKIDQEQEQEIQGLEQQNSGLASRLQQLQNVNSELEKKLAAMSGRRADKKSSAADVSIAPAPVSTKSTDPIAPKTKAKSKNKSQPAKSSMKSTAAQLASPKADPMAAMTNRITKGDSSVIDKVSGQSALPFEPSDNILEPVIPQAQANPKFAAARRDADDAEIKRYADLTSKIAKTAITDPDRRQSAYRVHEGDNEEQEAKYSDKYQDMVARVGQKAREQEKSNPVDIKDLARRLAAIEASRKDK